ncbi:hypothetical protein [Rhodanobacter lindaniclasticus]
MAVMVFFSTFVYVRNVPLGQPPDEWAQLSYIADITSGGPPIPDTPIRSSSTQASRTT